MTRICLNMIVKNENERIERCLASVAPFISCWAITDTGSTDDTAQTILEFFSKHEISGLLHQTTFKNFSQARNEALDHAHNPQSHYMQAHGTMSQLEFDYLLLIDADMELVVEDQFVFEHVTAPVYQMIQRSNTLTYWNTRLVRHDVSARYIGVTHEYLDTGGLRPEMLHGAWFRDYADGANRPGKIERDIALLEDDVRDKARSFFYLGNSYKESGKLAEAANAYETRSRLGGWAEEVWRARLERARVLRDDKNFPQFVEEALAAFSSRPWRAEPLYDLAKAYREKGMTEAALIFAERGLRIPKPSDDLLFIEDTPYNWGFKEEISIVGFYSDDPETREMGHKFCEELALARYDTRETLPSMQQPAPIRTEVLSNVSRRIYETVAKVASDDSGPETERQLSELRERIFTKKEDPKEALRAMWGHEFSNASPRLRSAIIDSLALSVMPSQSTHRNANLIPKHTHEQAWRNLFHYTKLLSEYAPSYRAKRIGFEPPDGYHPMNPSVARLGEKMYLNVRAVNYRIAPEGHYVMPEGEVSVRTRNFLFHLDDDLTEHLLGEISLPTDLPPPADSSVLGFEDIRLFPAGKDLWCNATTRQLNSEGWGEIVVARIGCGQILTNWSVIHPQGERRHEKNWMPVISKPDIFIYSCDPPQIIDREGRITQLQSAPISAAEWSGSSQVIPFDLTKSGLFGPDGYRQGFLALIHERIARPGIGKRQYQRRFVWFDKDLNIRRISHRFQFTDQSAGHEGGEFVCGMCMHPDMKCLVIAHGLLDREAWLVTVDADEVRAMLREVQPLPDTMKSAENAFDEERRAHDAIDDGGLPIDPNSNFNIPDKQPIYWLTINTNATLRTAADVDDAILLTKLRGWPVHPDRPKNWDVFLAVNHTRQHTNSQDAILDAGGDNVSTYLPTLRQLTYINLTSVNLLHTTQVQKNGIYYKYGNIEDTRFPDEVFTFISCLSTLEHDVDVAKFLMEAARILRPGGHLFISTDFWPDHIDTHIHGWQIFTPTSIKALIVFAADNGLMLTTPANLVCNERVVKHAGLEYTFVSLLFRKAN